MTRKLEWISKQIPLQTKTYLCLKEWTDKTVQRLQISEETWNNQVEYHLNMRSLLSYTSISEDSFNNSNSMCLQTYQQTM